MMTLKLKTFVQPTNLGYMGVVKAQDDQGLTIWSEATNIDRLDRASAKSDAFDLAQEIRDANSLSASPMASSLSY